MKKGLINFFAVVLSVMTAYVYGEKPVDEQFYIKLDAEGVASSVKLNGAVIEEESEGGITAEKQINKWLLEANNVLELDISALSEQVLANGGHANVMLYLHDNSQDFPTPKSVIAQLAFPSEDIELNPDQTLLSLKVDIDRVFSTNTTLYSDAEKITTLSESDKSDIVALLESIQTAILNGDTAKAASLQSYKIEEDARVEGKDPAYMANIASQTFAMIGQEEGVRAGPLRSEQLEFSFAWGGRLIQVKNVNGDEALMFENEEMAFGIPVFVSKIKGQWAVVR